MEHFAIIIVILSITVRPRAAAGQPFCHGGYQLYGGVAEVERNLKTLACPDSGRVLSNPEIRSGPEVALWEVWFLRMPAPSKLPRTPFMDRERSAEGRREMILPELAIPKL